MTDSQWWKRYSIGCEIPYEKARSMLVQLQAALPYLKSRKEYALALADAYRTERELLSIICNAPGATVNSGEP